MWRRCGVLRRWWCGKKVLLRGINVTLVALFFFSFQNISLSRTSASHFVFAPAFSLAWHHQQDHTNDFVRGKGQLKSPGIGNGNGKSGTPSSGTARCTQNHTREVVPS